MVGFTGTGRHPKGPRRAAARRTRRAVPEADLTLASVVGPRLVAQAGRAFTNAGDSYTPAVGDVVGEVVADTTRHSVVAVVRLR